MYGVSNLFARSDKILIFCAFASNNSAGVKVNTQLNTKNITKNSNTVEVPFSVRPMWYSVVLKSLYSRCWESVKEEIAGEWLKEKTKTGYDGE